MSIFRKYVGVRCITMKCKVCGKPCGNFVVCYEHRNSKYKDVCKIHGETTFINRQCQKCLKLKTPMFLVKNGKDRFGKKITKNHFLYPYLDRLTSTNLTRKYQGKYARRISNCSGIYGIFVKNTCLYVGQSTNISKRIDQHKENFVKAQRHIRGVHILRPRLPISKMKHKVEYKYYEMANSYKLKDLTFKTLFVIPYNKNKDEFNETLTYAEQAMMIAYNPKFNHIAARPTKK